jgi:hypothetical protein
MSQWGVRVASYKRNQIEEAISAVLESREPSSELRIRIKRLLETDRAFGRDRRSSVVERTRFAFFSAEPPGTGFEVWFSAYEGFALATALRLMTHGWSQTFAVSILRRVRPELEKQHDRVLKLDKKTLFDKEAIRRDAKEGDFAFDNGDPVLLTIVSKPGAKPDDESESHECAICRGPQKAMTFARDAGKGIGAWTMFELTTMAHRFSEALERTEPRHRGRSS